MFRRRPSAPRGGLFGRDLPALLEELGRNQAPVREERVPAWIQDTSRDIAWRADRFASSLLNLRDDPAKRVAATREICETAKGAGGWAAFGAYDLLESMYMSPPAGRTPEEQSMIDEVHEVSVRFLHSLGRRDFPSALSVRDTVLWRRLWPEEKE